MTATVTPESEVEGASEDLVPLPPRPEPSVLERVIGTTDHKVIGRLYIAMSMVFAGISFVLGLLSSIERADFGSEVFDDSTAIQLFSLHRVSLVFLVALPLTIGIALAVVPLQIGAQTLAFPRGAALSFWAWLISGVILVLSYVVDGGPGGAEADARQLWVAAFALVLGSLLLACVTLATTVLAARAPGMKLERVPYFSWSVFVAATVWILTLPVLIANVLLGYMSTEYGLRLVDLPIIGGAEETWLTTLWFSHRPQVLTLLIIGLGIVTEIVVTTSGVAMRHRSLVIGSIAAFGILSIGAWAQPVVFPSLTTDVLYTSVAFLVLIPALIVLGGWADTLRRGSISFQAPMVLAFAFVLMASAALAVGALAVIGSLDLVGTTADGSQLIYASLAAVIAAVAAMYWWAPKIWGRMLSDGVGLAAAAVLLLAAILAALPELISGFFEQPEPVTLADLADLAPLAESGLDSIVETMNVITVAGWGLALVGLLLAAVALAGRRDEEPVGDDPWGGGQTLEWSIPSPAPADNFDEVPTVTSATPLLRDDEGDA